MDSGMVQATAQFQAEMANLGQAFAIVGWVSFSFVAIALGTALIWAIHHRNDKE